MRTQAETDEQDIIQARRDRDDYFLAILNGNDDKCSMIEHKYELHGYPPEVVTVGLNAASKGEDVMLAVIKYVYGEDNLLLDHL